MKTPRRIASSLILVITAACAIEALDFDELLFPYVANGVATVQVMSALPEHIELRQRIDRGLEQLAVSYQTGTH